MLAAAGVTIQSVRFASGLIPRAAPAAVPACRMLNQPSSTEQCAEWYREKRFTSCFKCPTGQTSAAEPGQPSQRSCVRCGRTDLRLVHHALCVNCWNRTLEIQRGANAKGRWPRITAEAMRDFTALVKTQQRLSSLPETSIFTFERIDKQHVFVNGYFRDLAELTRFLSRIVGEHSILDIDSRPVLPPGDR